MVFLKPLFRLSLVKGTTASVLLHLRRGAEINGRDERGQTPLMLAAAGGRHDICLLLLAEGADSAAVCGKGRTAADIAVAAGHAGLGRALAPPGRDPVALRAFPAPAATAATRGAFEPEDGPEAGEDGGWEVEAEFHPGENDAAVELAAGALQSAMDRLRRESTDAAWQDVEIVLPETASGRPNQGVAGLELFLRRALSRGVVTPAGLRRAGRGAPWLAAIVDDLGVERRRGALPVRLTELAPRRLDAGDLDRLEDAGVLAACLAEDRLAIDLYASELARLPVIDRSAEQSMFRALNEAKRHAIRALLEALPYTTALPTTPAVHDEAEEEGDGLDLPAATPPAGLLAAILAIQRGAAVADPDSLAAHDLDLALIDRICADLVGRPADAAALRAAAQRYVARRNRVLTAFLPLVLKVAPWYRRPGAETDDLVQEGNIGLLRAVERFDVNRGHRFATFAIWWVRQQCGRRNEELSRTIRLPVHVIETCTRLERSRRTLYGPGGGGPEAAVAEGAGVTGEKARELAAVWLRTVSLDDPRLAGYAVRRADPVGDEGFERTLAAQRIRTLGCALGALPGRQEWIVRARFGLGGCEDRTLEEVGSTMGVTRERIRQLEAKALQALGRPGSPDRRRLRQLL